MYKDLSGWSFGMLMNKIKTILLLSCFFTATLFADEVVIGIHPRPIPKKSLFITPFVVPDLISAKASFEYKVHKKLNLIIPLEAKWANYGFLFSKIAQWTGSEEVRPENWYSGEYGFKPGWDINISQLKISTGLGLKYLPFSDGFDSEGFYLKTSTMLGFEHFYLYNLKKSHDNLVVTESLSLGYSFMTDFGLIFGPEMGCDYVWHIQGPKNLPRYINPVLFISGFVPFLQANIGIYW